MPSKVKTVKVQSNDIHQFTSFFKLVSVLSISKKTKCLSNDIINQQLIFFADHIKMMVFSLLFLIPQQFI
jgi:hypothetical protein